MKAAVVQARTQSTRLPAKVLADVCGHTMLERVIERVAAATTLDQTVLATTVEESDTPLADLAASLGVGVFRGSVDDVLDRFYRAAEAYGIETIVRVTADCPLIDPAIIDMSVTTFLDKNVDYVSTAYPEPSFPDGLDVEVFSFDALERAWNQASLPSEREHVTPYIWSNPLMFRLHRIQSPTDLSKMRWTVDEEADLRFVREVFGHLERAGRTFGMRDILDLLNEHPELLEINRHIERNEGYQRSLREEMNEGTR